MLSVALLAIGLVALPASAQSSPSGQAESYAAQANGSALALTLAGQQLTVGAGQVALDSTPKASANASGALLLTTPVGASSAAATQNGQNVVDGTASAPKCGPLTLPASVPVVGLATACSYSQAAVAGGLPSATAGGKSLDLSLATSSLPAALTTQLKSAITALTGQLSDALDPTLGSILKPLTGGANPVSLNQLGTLLNLLTTDPDSKLATVVLGASTSTVSATAATVTADSTAVGGTICIGDVAGLCLITITIGTAKATAVRDRAANTATPTVNPSIVTIQVLPVLFDGLKAIPGVGAVLDQLFPTQSGTPTLTLQQGQTITIPGVLTLVASSGTATKTNDGATASASSLKLTLLGGTVSLALADANAAVAGHAATPGSPASPATTAPPNQPKTLAYTGSNEPWRPIMAGLFLVLAIAGLEVARRARRRSVEY